MRQRDPFGTALASLRTAIEDGLAPGQHLSVADIAASLNLSTSPVREALSRLCGEGLIEDRRGLGYFTRATPLEDILGLLDLEAAHVRLAARGAGFANPIDGSDGAVDAWIIELIEVCENQPLLESLARVGRRLAPLRGLGPSTEPPAGPSDGDSIDAYYARWRITAGTIASRVRRIDPDQSKYTRNIV
ncbi:GntR family transcriptional regulator [Brevundimonas vesicularis]|uniref:GntR family transcriptional regulator n=1 Tax=Brevundimonas vesicularis TaxID=41276 RepID=UPI00384D2F16